MAIPLAFKPGYYRPLQFDRAFKRFEFSRQNPMRSKIKTKIITNIDAF